MNATSPPSASTPISLAEIDASARVPLFTWFVSAAVWLVVASVFSVIASMKFHVPSFLADCPLMTYGRVHAAANNALLYGFAIPAGLRVALWLFARRGRVCVVGPGFITVGAKLWNLGVLVGTLGILGGDATEDAEGSDQ